MKLISCDNCAVVLDHDKLPFAKSMWNEDESGIDETKAMYNQFMKTYHLFVPCPVCRVAIFKED